MLISLSLATPAPSSAMLMIVSRFQASRLEAAARAREAAIENIRKDDSALKLDFPGNDDSPEGKSDTLRSRISVLESLMSNQLSSHNLALRETI